MTNLPTPEQRLRDLLAPIDAPEKSLVQWLGTWDQFAPTMFADMIERATSTARAAGFDAGYQEGVEYERQQWRAALDRNAEGEQP